MSEITINPHGAPYLLATAFTFVLILGVLLLSRAYIKPFLRSLRNPNGQIQLNELIRILFDITSIWGIALGGATIITPPFQFEIKVMIWFALFVLILFITQDLHNRIVHKNGN